MAASDGLKDLFKDSDDPNELARGRAMLWKELRACWFCLNEIEKGARDIRDGLPLGDPLRMKLLTLETLASIRLSRPRRSFSDLLKRLEAGMAEGDDGE